MDGILQVCIFHWKWIGKNQFLILKNTILNPLGILCIPQNIWLLDLLDLLARLYLKVKCIFECIFYDSSELENVPLLNVELTLILQFCFLDAIINTVDSMIWIFKQLNSLKSNYLTNYLQRKTSYLLSKTYNDKSNYHCLRQICVLS